MRKSEGQRIPEKEIANFQFVELNNGYIVTWFFTKSGGFFFLSEVITM